MISVKNVIHQYTSHSKGLNPIALNNLSFTVPTGSFCVILGPNGSGKSTLFQLLSGMQKPSSGHIAIAGDACTSAQARRNLGIVFQSPALDTILTVRENLTFFGKLHGITGRSLQDRIRKVMAWTQIEDRLDTPVGHLSGGQQRQAELAKCLIPSPSTLLLDEPTTGLDPNGRQAFQDVILHLRDHEGLTILMTTHIFTEADAADMVVIMDKGQKIAEGTPRALCDSMGTEMITIQTKSLTPEAIHTLANQLHSSGLVTAQATPQDVRLKDLHRGEAAAIVSQIMAHHGDTIAAIAIKQPTLDDVFLSLTAQGAA
jgi:ABC-2 type transport system ATP-binding protein